MEKRKAPEDGSKSAISCSKKEPSPKDLAWSQFDLCLSQGMDYNKFHRSMTVFQSSVNRNEHSQITKQAIK